MGAKKTYKVKKYFCFRLNIRKAPSSSSSPSSPLFSAWSWPSLRGESLGASSSPLLPSLFFARPQPPVCAPEADWDVFCFLLLYFSVALSQDSFNFNAHTASVQNYHHDNYPLSHLFHRIWFWKPGWLLECQAPWQRPAASFSPSPHPRPSSQGPLAGSGSIANYCD